MGFGNKYDKGQLSAFISKGPPDSIYEKWDYFQAQFSILH